MKLYRRGGSHCQKVVNLALWFRRFGSRKMLRVVRFLAVKGTKMVTAVVLVMLMLMSHFLLLTMYTNIYYKQVGQKAMEDYIAQNKIHVQNPRFLMYNTQSKSGSDIEMSNTNKQSNTETYVKHSHRWRRKSEIENEQNKTKHPVNKNTQKEALINSDGAAHGQPGRSFNRSLIVYLEQGQKPKIPQYNKDKLLDLKQNMNKPANKAHPIKNAKEKPNQSAKNMKDQQMIKVDHDSAENKGFPNPVALNAKPKTKPTRKSKVTTPKPTKVAKEKCTQCTTPCDHSKNGSTTPKPANGKYAVLNIEEINVIHKSDVEWDPTDDWKEEHFMKVPVKKKLKT